MTNEKCGEAEVRVSPLTAIHHSMRHAPTHDEGTKVAKLALTWRRMDRFLIHYDLLTRDRDND